MYFNRPSISHLYALRFGWCVYSLGRSSLIANMQFSCMCEAPIDQKLIKILKHAKIINKIWIRG